MRKNIFLFSIFVLIGALFHHVKAYTKCDLSSLGYDPTILQTKVGKIQGACYIVPVDDPDRVNRTENIMTWMAVPYAEPPINDLRFRKPVPVKPWTNVRNGTSNPNKCMQNAGGMGPPPAGGASTPAVSEDCLYLNIYAPAKLFVKPAATPFGFRNNFARFGYPIPQPVAPKLSPIMVFIHGGAFIMGSGDENDPSIITALSDVIVVTINYRLGPFGFMYLSGSNITGNQGFLDQSLAIKWVHDNALTFGGDPNRITISGQSAGSFSVSFHLIYPPSWPYFRNAIMESGTISYSTMDPFTPEEATRRTRLVLASLGCGSNDTSLPYNPADVNACALKLNPTSILSASDNFSDTQLLKGNKLAKELTPTFRFVLDGVEFKDTIQQSMEKRTLKMANILIGFCHDEAGFQIAISGLLGGMGGPPNPSASQNFSINSTVFQNFVNQFYYYFPTYPNVSSNAFRTTLMNTYTNQSTTDYLTPLIQMMSEEAFICPAIDLATIYSKYYKLNKVFLYSYDYLSNTTSSPFPKSLGVIHGSELAMVFGEPLSSVSRQSSSNSIFQNPFSKTEKEFSKQIIAYWTNFIKNDDPNVHDYTTSSAYTNWPIFNAGPAVNVNPTNFQFFNRFYGSFNNFVQPLNNYLVLKGNDTKTSNDFSFRKCDFWRQYNNYPTNL